MGLAKVMRFKRYLFMLMILLCIPLSMSACRQDGKRRKPVNISTAPAERAPVVSGKTTRVYHLRECQFARDIHDKELLGFATTGEAAASGRIPCVFCVEDAVKNGSKDPSTSGSEGRRE